MMKGYHNNLKGYYIYIYCKYIQNKNINDLNALTFWSYVLSVNCKLEQKKSSIV